MRGAEGAYGRGGRARRIAIDSIRRAEEGIRRAQVSRGEVSDAWRYFAEEVADAQRYPAEGGERQRRDRYPA